MPSCVRCSKEIQGLFGTLQFNKQTGRCSKCESEVKQALERFRQAFLYCCQDGDLSPLEWNQLLERASFDRLNIHEALAYIRTDALNLLERMLSFAFSDGYITDDEERHIYEISQVLTVPAELTANLFERLRYLRYITSIRQGRLPSVTPSVHLGSDEICHLETGASYYKVNARSVTQVPGRLIATNKKILFVSPSGGVEIPLKNVMRVEDRKSTIYLELSTKRGNGTYWVSDPLLVSSVLETLSRISKRQLLAPQSDSESRHIPQDVKQAVWQRDQGRCVQCGATSYLEFDHIIPHSKGGANTVNNVQLLCRNCNLQKSDRI